MTVIYSLEPRSLSTGLAQRTRKNLEFMQRAHEKGEDIHIVTQVINSTLSLLVFPQQKEKLFFARFQKVKLSNPPDMRAVKKALPNFPALASLRVRQFSGCEDLASFFRRMRNALSHRRIDFGGDADYSHDLNLVILRLTDGPSPNSTNWDIDLSAHDLLALCLYLADEIIQEVL